MSEDAHGDAGLKTQQLQAALSEFGGDSCSCCMAWHERDRRGWKLAVNGEPVCSWRCAAHLMWPNDRRSPHS